MTRNNTDMKAVHVAEYDDGTRKVTVRDTHDDASYVVRFGETEHGGLTYLRVKGYGHGHRGDRPHLAMQAARMVAIQHLAVEDELPVLCQTPSNNFGWGNETPYTIADTGHVYEKRSPTTLCGRDVYNRGHQMLVTTELDTYDGMCGNCRRVLESRLEDREKVKA